MKYAELHRILIQNGWIRVQGKGKGSHVWYVKHGKYCVVPYHGSHEISIGLAKKILKDIGIK